MSLCACRETCGDVAERDDSPLAVCKGLPVGDGRLARGDASHDHPRDEPCWAGCPAQR